MALVGVLVFTGRGAASQHPTPRVGVTAEKVLPAVTIPPTPGAAEAYVVARQIPQILDGIYCHCDCSKHMGHRSLLTCYETDHAAQCDICMGEAMLASQMVAGGSSLAQIRAAVDSQFNR